MFSCQFESPHLGIIPRLYTSCLDEVVFLVWASPALIWCKNKKRHTKRVHVIKYGKAGTGVLGPQHMMIIKSTNSNFSSSFYNYAYPKGNEKKNWNMGRGVRCHMAAQTKLPKHFRNKQGAFLGFSLLSVTTCELNMWEAPFEMIQTGSLSFGLQCVSWKQKPGVLGEELQWGPCRVWIQYCKGCRSTL